MTARKAPPARSLPSHAIVRSTHAPQGLQCRCGERVAGTTDPDAARRVLARHILEREATR